MLTVFSTGWYALTNKRDNDLPQSSLFEHRLDATCRVKKHPWYHFKISLIKTPTRGYEIVLPSLLETSRQEVIVFYGLIVTEKLYISLFFMFLFVNTLLYTYNFKYINFWTLNKA